MGVRFFYRVFSRETGKLLAEGTASECAKHFGTTESAFRNRVDRARDQGARRSWTVETVPIESTKELSQSTKEAIENWDAFCEPIRKRFGIKVKRMWENK